MAITIAERQSLLSVSRMVPMREKSGSRSGELMPLVMGRGLGKGADAAYWGVRLTSPTDRPGEAGGLSQYKSICWLGARVGKYLPLPQGHRVPVEPTQGHPMLNVLESYPVISMTIGLAGILAAIGCAIGLRDWIRHRRLILRDDAQRRQSAKRVKSERDR